VQSEHALERRGTTPRQKTRRWFWPFAFLCAGSENERVRKYLILLNFEKKKHLNELGQTDSK
jgi:hypothetical protein